MGFIGVRLSIKRMIVIMFYWVVWYTLYRGQYRTNVCVFSSHSIWTSSSLDVPAGVTQEEGHTGFLIHLLSAVRALIFLARRIQPFLSLVDREVEFCLLLLLLLLLLFVVSHIQRIGRQPEKNYFTRWPIPLVVC